jgi:predicted  nucleic acid-binding Zn-ribbon protein
MWKELVAFLQTLFTLSRDQQQARDEIKEIRQDLTKLTLAVSHLVNKIDLVQQEDSSGREKLAMQLQIELLKFEKQLPKATSPKTKVKPRPDEHKGSRDDRR